MKLTIKITMENAAFGDGNSGLESARILRALADRLERRGDLDGGFELFLFDVNGNKVGKAQTTSRNMATY